MPTRSRLKVQRQQRALAVVLLLSLVLFACVEDRVVDGLGRDTTSTSTDAASADDAAGGEGDGGDAPADGAGAEPVASGSTDTGPLANDDGYDGWVDPASSGNPWTSEVEGLLTFRGNPTRSYYGMGPVPEAPEILWSVPPEGGFCGESSVGGEAKTWCGTGWTGQPSVWEDGDRTWVAFGAYDKNVHFLDADSGEDLLPPFAIGDIVKGSVTRDPDGFPLLYSGSRADFHVIATDREQPESLWSMDAEDVQPTLWNDDWDSSPLVIDDYLFEGGENSQFFIVKLNRALGDDGLVTVDPEIVFNAPGWDDELLADLSGSGSRGEDVSIENSLVVVGDTLYFTNSGGLIQGWDISGLADGEPPERTFRFWSGDDTDASLVADDEGMLYFGQQVERSSTSARSQEVGQLVKLDPSNPEDPIVWSIADDHGIWATPGLADGVVIAPTDSGRIIGADAETGEILWEKQLPGPTWSSPVIVDDVWVQGDCAGTLHGFDLSDPRVDPPELWTVEVEGCIESTPGVWDGRIFVGARGGRFYAFGDA
ncbi:PQQ-binding-like beta-propeller repeat protein [Iamia sp. SCSIO 61187]|uniref:outer membrane protein assembly factor BamB family protein n=1 Tax=Iamia sp. SCSIO 61187 TaxID=2722752 RepID=UPI001C625B96|nr:PQQ-binding-like beta-propeller repeat protein [Iamia sp. SCSIO 61187]QYG91207.1 PQQ-binding-like beta-propeller repeat protein [Iamia sp. SCSIO 61187]